MNKHNDDGGFGGLGSYHDEWPELQEKFSISLLIYYGFEKRLNTKNQNKKTEINVRYFFPLLYGYE